MKTMREGVSMLWHGVDSSSVGTRPGGRWGRCVLAVGVVLACGFFVAGCDRWSCCGGAVMLTCEQGELVCYDALSEAERPLGTDEASAIYSDLAGVWDADCECDGLEVISTPVEVTLTLPPIDEVQVVLGPPADNPDANFTCDALGICTGSIAISGTGSADIDGKACEFDVQLIGPQSAEGARVDAYGVNEISPVGRYTRSVVEFSVSASGPEAAWVSFLEPDQGPGVHGTSCTLTNWQKH